MAEEITIYEKNDIKITNLRAVFGSKTYAINSITSVEAKSENKTGCAPAGLFIGGLFIAVFGYAGDGNGLLVFGLILAFMGLGVLLTAKATYIVQIASASGEIKAFTSKNKTDIDPIVTALNDAIIKKG